MARKLKIGKGGGNAVSRKSFDPRKGGVAGGKQKGRPAPAVQLGLPEEYEDEVDAFHKSRDKITFEPSDESGGSEDVEDDAVYDLSEEDEGDLDEGDGRFDDEYIAKLEAEERRMRRRVAALKGEDDDVEEEAKGDEEDEDEAGPGVRDWGKKKREFYHRAEEEEGEEDSEYEQEARRLQKAAAASLRPEDYGDVSSEEGGSDSEDGDDAPEEHTLGRRALLEERIQAEDGEVLLPAEKRAAVLADAPVLASLLGDMQLSLAELRTRVTPLLQEMKDGQILTAEGLTYLEAKNLLLLNYCSCLVFVVLLRAEGRPFQDHPVLVRLVELRTLMEKIRPIDKRMAYQIDRLLAAARLAQNGGAEKRLKEGEEGGEEDPLSFRPKPDALALGVADEAAAAEGDGIYRPPRFNPVAMDTDPDKDHGRASRRREEHRMRKAKRSEILNDMVAEELGAPEEVSFGNQQSLQQRKVADALARRAEREENLFLRVNLSKEEKRKLKLRGNETLAGGTLLDDLADDISALVEERVGKKTGDAAFDDAWQRQRVSQKFGANLTSSGRGGGGGRSGDADLPFKAPLSERRAKMDSVRAVQNPGPVSDNDDDDGDAFADFDMGGGRRGKNKKGMGKRGRELDGDGEDPFYVETARAAKARKAERGAAYAAAPLAPPLAPDVAAGPRGVTREVEKNRGLTPHRRKDTKNPRVRNKTKFAKAVVRRKGQVTDVRPAGTRYGGEATGIKAKVSKSRRF